jgi:hypothetical protein
MKFALDIFGKTGRKGIKDQYAKSLKREQLNPKTLECNRNE